MGRTLRNQLLFFTALTLGLFAASFAGAGKKSKTSGTQAIQNKNCGYYLRYPKGSQLDHPSDCALKITLPTTHFPKWVDEASLTLYTAPANQPQIGETPEGESGGPAGSLVASGMKFTKTFYEDAAMSHRFITVVYEATGKYRKYRFEGFMKVVVPDVIDMHVKDWDPQKYAEKTFDDVVSTFVPLN